ncbi:MAG: magnesium and cobalt transport protein CorA, partial [Bacteroidota bacterium]|nr:magnesium and cobalt transport protein CorA [Bacteroidota bacterium]
MAVIRPKKYLRYLVQPLFGTQRTKEILHVNPTIVPQREEAADVRVFVFDYDEHHLEEKQLDSVDDALVYKENNRVSWINIDGLRKADVEKISEWFGVHPLTVEDILSIHQRPKMEEGD